MNKDILTFDKVVSIIDLNQSILDVTKENTYLFLKRVFDIIFSIIGIILLVPLSLFIKIAYICRGDFSSIFYTQKRIGKNGKTFNIIKFRSMVVDADQKLSELLERNPELKKEYIENKKLRNDPRVTAIGRFIRKTSIDEMPQFVNVLFGTMSVIGNRPYLLREREEMGSHYRDIISVKPGITGYWQVLGHNDISFKQRLELEEEYANKASLTLDVKIFFKTFGVLLGKKGV